ncbi:MAG: hypothetical protein HC839_00605 [Leptolyngbyaceae cyanobacterium RM2_2_21]|nr:hypothetical protein [Leptolyngbyaceae cyanobacterium RM2_2_21]
MALAAQQRNGKQPIDGLGYSTGRFLTSSLLLTEDSAKTSQVWHYLSEWLQARLSLNKAFYMALLRFMLELLKSSKMKPI